MAMECDEPSSAPTGGSSNPAATSSLFDLETYISRYDVLSETRLQRLLFVAKRGKSDDVCRLAYQLAERQVREAGNMRKYREIFYPRSGGGSASGEGSGGGMSGGSGSGEAASEGAPEATSSSSPEADHHPSKYGFNYDSQFVSVTDQSSALHLETLEARLTTAQAHLSKEAIRTAYLALGEHHRKRGELREAMKKLLRSRDFCTNNRQTGQVCLQVIELGIDSHNLTQVRDYVAKAEHTSDLLHADSLFASKLRVASALVLLADSRFEDAARKLASVSAECTTQFNTVVSAEDIALYGALLGLATLDRSALQTLVLNGPDFKGRLELVPPLRDALRHYVRAEYGPCLSLLSALKPELLLDIHLAPHAEALLAMIRDRCIVQYFAPYTQVSLRTMGDVFGMDVDAVESAVASLIKAGKIRNARINAIDMTLKSESKGGMERRRRREARSRVVRLGKTFVTETEGMILRLSCLENDLVVQAEGGGRGKIGWRGAGGGRMRGRGGYEAGGMRYDIDSSDDDEELMGDAEAMDIDVGLAA